MPIGHPRIIMVSNRLPVRVIDRHDGPHVTESPGGLVRALGAVMRRRGDVWIGWAGVPGEVDLDSALEVSGVNLGYRLHPVPVSASEHEDFYKGFANEVVWPLFHDVHTYCAFKERYWATYLRINERFADHITAEAAADDLIWIHDYHLMNVSEGLRANGVDNRLGFFLHIPFPGPDVFKRRPWRAEVLAGLLAYDTLGFQTRHDLDNFIHTLRALRADAMIRRIDDRFEIHIEGRIVQAGAFPIGIDPEEIHNTAASEAVTDQVASLRRQFEGRIAMIGMDRLDYTKGIPDRIEAYRQVLEERPDLHEKVVFIQHVAPSREDLPRYHELKEEIERRVGELNGRFGTVDWTPLNYLYNTMGFVEVLALYRFAQVALVTPLKDGMNLVSMEYCAAQVDDPGVLIISEFAGASTHVKKGAILVNPHDTSQVADAIVRAIEMAPEERQRRNRAILDVVRANDVYEWVERFVEAGLMEPAVGLYRDSGHVAHSSP